MQIKKYLLHHKSTFLILAMSASVSSVAIAAPAKTTAEEVEVSVTVTDTVATPEPMSLIEVLAYALDHNPQRQAAWYAVKAAQGRIGTAKADGGLQINLNGSISNQWGFGKVGTAFPTGGGATNAQGWRSSISADAVLPIYSGGRVKGNKKVAQYNYQQAIAQAVGTEQNLVYSTTINYLDILRNQQLVDVNQTNLDVARERSRIANVRFNAGAAAKLEVLRADTDEATAQQNLVEAENSLKQAYANLNTVMGRAPQTPLAILPIDQLTLPQPLIANSAQLGKSTFTGETSPGNLSATTNSNYQMVNASLAGGQQLAEIANSSSPTLAALQAQVLAAEAAVGVAKAGKKPSLGLSLGGLISNPVSYLGRFVLSLGGSLLQNLFDSGRTRSQVRTAKATVLQLKSSLKGGELNVANQIEHALLALNSAKEREESTTSAVISAQEALRAAQLGYSAGVQTALDVSDAEAALLTAQTNSVNAKFDIAAAQAQLAASVGVLTDEGQEAYDQSVPLQQVSDKKDKKKKK